MSSLFFNEHVNEFLLSPHLHATSSDSYRYLEELWINSLRSSFLSNHYVDLILFEKQCFFPAVQQGAVDSANLLGLFELMLFRWYSIIANHGGGGPTCAAVDIGANIGFHSLFMAKCFDRVNSFDPDINHKSNFLRVMEMNDVSDKVTLNNMAVTDQVGISRFTRVLDNPTASYVDSLKQGYGPLEYVNVPTVPANAAVDGALLLKIDAEGSEFKILRSLAKSQWEKGLICFFEISSSVNRQPIFDLLSSHGVSLYPQSISWSVASAYTQLPNSWRDGNCMAFMPSDLNNSIYVDFMNT